MRIKIIKNLIHTDQGNTGSDKKGIHKSKKRTECFMKKLKKLCKKDPRVSKKYNPNLIPRMSQIKQYFLTQLLSHYLFLMLVRICRLCVPPNQSFQIFWTIEEGFHQSTLKN